MLDPNNYQFCSEFDVVEKSIEVVVKIGGEQRRVKIDAILERSGSYSTREYIEDFFELKSAFSDEVKQTTLWVPYDFPWTHGDSADTVLKRALDFLEERL